MPVGLFRLFRRRHLSEWALRAERDDKNTGRLLRRLLKKDSSCVDVGAHVGTFLERFIQLSPAGKHYAFEPLPLLASGLRTKFPTVEVHSCALSNRAGMASFYHVPGLEAWSGLQMQEYPQAAEPKVIQVELKRLDDVLGMNVQVDFIKIDVEGAELEVLTGAEATIKRCRPVILFEHAKIHNEHYPTTPAMVYDFLVDGCGLEIWDLQLSRAFGRSGFADVYEASAASNYDRKAQTNFVARPR